MAAARAHERGLDCGRAGSEPVGSGAPMVDQRIWWIVAYNQGGRPATLGKRSASSSRAHSASGDQRVGMGWRPPRAATARTVSSMRRLAAWQVLLALLAVGVLGVVLAILLLWLAFAGAVLGLVLWLHLLAVPRVAA